MILPEYDINLENLVKIYAPRWSEIQPTTLDFSKRDENTFLTDAIMFVGKPSLVCCVASKDLAKPRIEYFPIHLESKGPERATPLNGSLLRAGEALRNSNEKFSGYSRCLRCVC
jgi:hypothetical protein